MLESYFFSLPEFEGKNFQEVKDQCHKLLSRYPNLNESVKALADFTNNTIKRKAYVVAADIAMASGDVDEAEDKMLDAKQRHGALKKLRAQSTEE